MGTILQGTCSKCGYRAELFTGGGRLDCEPQTALQAAHNDSGLAAALKEGAWFRIDRNVAICSRCHKFVTGVNVTYQQKGRQGRRITGGCPSCGGPLLAWTSGDTDGIPCPVCGQPVSLVPAGIWD